MGYKTPVAETVQEVLRETGEPTQNFIAALVTQNASESGMQPSAAVPKNEPQKRSAFTVILPPCKIPKITKN
ncbi:MAG: hypothetical protein U0586_12595 [Candidatus Brocadiaceae bacterium]